MDDVWTKIKFVWKEKFTNVLKNSFLLAVKQKICFLKRKGLEMKNKTFIYECNCIHCQQKLNQINNAKLYWDKLVLRKKLV